MTRFSRRSWLCLAVLAVPGCRSHDVVHELDWSFNRMQQQPRYDPYASSNFFDDGKTMREPVLGTVPYSDKEPGTPETSGMVAGEYVTNIPLPITREFLALGRKRFDAICSNCHGIRGDGDSVVATFMGRRPPSLHELRVRMLRNGVIFRIARDGYGLMPSYAAHLTEEETWAVVGYVRALERSQNAVAARLPPGIHSDWERAAP